MIVLQPIGTSQVIKFIPTRVGICNELILTDDTTKVSVRQYIDSTIESFYSKFSAIVTIEEGKYYDLVINENQIKTEIDAFAARVVADGGTYVNESCLYTFLEGFDYNTTLIHRDKVFCTAQNVDDYTINSGQYVADSQTIIFHD